MQHFLGLDTDSIYLLLVCIKLSQGRILDYHRSILDRELFTARSVNDVAAREDFQNLYTVKSRFSPITECIMAHQPLTVLAVCTFTTLQSLTGSIQGRIIYREIPCSHYREWVCRVHFFSVLVTCFSLF